MTIYDPVARAELERMSEEARARWAEHDVHWHGWSPEREPEPEAGD